MQESLKQLYKVFASYKANLNFASLETPIPKDFKTKLLTTPLEQLTAQDLSAYSLKAITTWGDAQDFRYFLPRLLEVIFEDREILFSKLTYARWRQWPKEQQEALDAYFKDYWKNVLIVPGAAETTLCCLGQALDDLTPYLRLWQDYGDAPDEPYLQTSLEQLRSFLKNNHEALICKTLTRNAFWQYRPTPCKQVVDWFCSPATVECFDSRWQNRQYSSCVGSDSVWLEDTIKALKDFQSLPKKEPSACVVLLSPRLKKLFSSSYQRMLWQSFIVIFLLLMMGSFLVSGSYSDPAWPTYGLFTKIGCYILGSLFLFFAIYGLYHYLIVLSKRQRQVLQALIHNPQEIKKLTLWSVKPVEAQSYQFADKIGTRQYFRFELSDGGIHQIALRSDQISEFLTEIKKLAPYLVEFFSEQVTVFRF